jgi:glycosyltransferase involved in cell wall biosynthesis
MSSLGKVITASPHIQLRREQLSWMKPITIELLEVLINRGTPLKIAHLVTSPAGGAGTAALRLNAALLSEGHDSKVISVERRHVRDVDGFRQQHSSILKKISSSTLTWAQMAFIQKGTDPVTPASLGLLDWTDPTISEAEVLHLHAFYNLVLIEDFLNLYPDKAKFVTFHDERFYTGGCHQSHGCKLLHSGCNSCPQVTVFGKGLVQRTRKRIIAITSDHPSTVFICPSEWIRKRAIEALPEIEEGRFRKVFNPIPSAPIFPDTSTSNSVITFGFVAQNLDNPIKNLKLLLNAFLRIDRERPNEYKLKLVGNSNVDYSAFSPQITQFEANSNEELQSLLQEIDALVVPSTHDNLPNVLGEALMCGVSLIGSDVGGIPEVLKEFDQKVFESGNENQLYDSLIDFKKADRSKIRAKAEEIFGFRSSAKTFGEIYLKAITEIGTTSRPAS